MAIFSTEVREEALLGQDFATEHGTVVHASVRYELGRSVRQVLDHYRRELPVAGWEVTEDQPPQNGDSSGQRWHVLRVQNDDREATIAAEPASDTTTTLRISTLDRHERRKPSQHPPVITMPGWYEALPAPPPGTRRYRVRITTGVDAPTTYTLQYEPDPLQDAAPEALEPATLTAHYTRRLPGSGWVVGAADERTERPDEQEGVIEQRHVRIPITGHGVAGEVIATQTMSAAGQRLDTQLTLTIRPVHEPGRTP